MRDKKQEAELKKRRIEQNIKTLSLRMAEAQQELKMETEELKRWNRRRMSTGRRSTLKSDGLRRRSMTNTLRVLDRQQRAPLTSSCKNAWKILGGAVFLAAGGGIGAGVVLMTAAAPAAPGALAAAAATGREGAVPKELRLVLVGKRGGREECDRQHNSGERSGSSRSCA
ncbi:hypothetical protein SKAU_G00294900 [Synaphobranchus kaupii]|uniref:Uncharacterized protein n=1 Tax=Synaphobranchus kaupii TaxID=118154 RepID=A0A9Q1ILQ8_SYNKA|nr:hypothetical protein SKAU_G00294900 [Synaphobranchus kaupii]